MDNYESETGREEVVTQQEKHENQHFIDSIYETEPMKIAHEYLAGKGLVAAVKVSSKGNCMICGLQCTVGQGIKGE